MDQRQRVLLQLPQGVRALFFEEAERHQEILLLLRGLFTSWGYRPVQTPVVDFFDVYRPLLNPQDQEAIYRLIDREGDLLMLRSDITLFLAKNVGSLLSTQDLPLRLWYADTILRHQEKEDISKSEFYQSGAELIGRTGPHADLEILTLLLKNLDLLGAGGYVVHLGSRGLFETCFKGLDHRARLALAAALGHRNREAFLEALREAGTPPPEAGRLLGLFFFIGQEEDFTALCKQAEGDFRGSLRAELSYLAGLLEKLGRLGLGDRFRLDLSEIGGQPYYSGIVFKAYRDGIGAEIASGGRYDTLLERFGFPAPAIGFSIMVSRLEGVVPLPLDKAAPPTPVAGEDFVQCYHQAEEIRSAGGAAVLGTGS